MRRLQHVVVLVVLLRAGWTLTSADEPRAETGERPVLQAIVPAPDEFDPYSLVSVCPFNGSWWVLLHSPPGVDAEKASRARNQLQAPDFTDCLAKLVLTDPATLPLVENAIRSIDLSKNPARMDLEAAVASNTAVRKRWTQFGVDAVINEVAETGSRGDRVARVLAACESLSVVQGEESK